MYRIGEVTVFITDSFHLINFFFFFPGTWTLLDIYVFPIKGSKFDSEVESAYESDYYWDIGEYIDHKLEQTLWISLGLGIGISFIGFVFSILIAPVINKLYKKACLSKNYKYKILWVIFWLIEKIFYYIVGFGGVTFWRGIWYFWDRYILVDDLAASAWISHAIGFGCLALLFASKSALAPPLLPLLDGGKETSFSLPLPRYEESDPFILLKSIFKGKKQNEIDELSSRNLSEIV